MRTARAEKTASYVWTPGAALHKMATLPGLSRTGRTSQSGRSPGQCQTSGAGPYEDPVGGDSHKGQTLAPGAGLAPCPVSLEGAEDPLSVGGASREV